MTRTFCIAEAGSCHDGDYEQALRLITAAKAAGADAVKFQWWSSAKRLAERRRAPAYEAIYTKYQVPVVWLSWLALACKNAGIEFMSTVYLPEDVPMVDKFVRRHKIASFECQDDALWRAVRATTRPIVVSTGMLDMETPATSDAALTLVDRLDAANIILHCVSAYPTPLDQANLGAISAMARRWPRVGFSDHTRSTLTGGLAVAAGAMALEVHFRLDDTDSANPDYATALTPAQLRDYVDFMRLTERMLGSGAKVPQPAEAEMAQYRVQP